MSPFYTFYCIFNLFASFYNTVHTDKFHFKFNVFKNSLKVFTLSVLYLIRSFVWFIFGASCSLHVYSSQQLSKFVFSFIFQTTALTFMSLFFLSGLPNLCSASFPMFQFSATAGAVCGASSPSLCLSSDWMD